MLNQTEDIFGEPTYVVGGGRAGDDNSDDEVITDDDDFWSLTQDETSSVNSDGSSQLAPVTQTTLQPISPYNHSLQTSRVLALRLRLAQGVGHEMRAALLEMKHSLDKMSEMASTGIALKDLNIKSAGPVFVYKKFNRLFTCDNPRAQRRIEVILERCDGNPFPENFRRRIEQPTPENVHLKLLKRRHVVAALDRLQEALGLDPDVQAADDEKLLRLVKAGEDGEHLSHHPRDDGGSYDNADVSNGKGGSASREHLLRELGNLDEMAKAADNIGYPATFHEFLDNFHISILVEVADWSPKCNGAENKPSEGRARSTVMSVINNILETCRPDGDSDDNWFLMPSESLTSFKRMAKAIDEVKRLNDGRDESELSIRQIMTDTRTPQVAAREEVPPARDLAQRPNQVFRDWSLPAPALDDDDCLTAAMDAKRKVEENIVVQILNQINSIPASVLNTVQRDELWYAWKRSFTLLQGPPGTGKTHVIAQLVRAVAAVLYGGVQEEKGPLEDFDMPKKLSSKSVRDWTARDVKDLAGALCQLQSAAAPFAPCVMPMISRILYGKSGRFLQTMNHETATEQVEYAFEEVEERRPTSEEMNIVVQALMDIATACNESAHRGKSDGTALEAPAKMLLCAASNPAVWNLLTAVETAGVPEELLLLHCSEMRASYVPAHLQKFTIHEKMLDHQLYRHALKPLQDATAWSHGGQPTPENKADVSRVCEAANKVVRHFCSQRVDALTQPWRQEATREVEQPLLDAINTVQGITLDLGRGVTDHQKCEKLNGDIDDELERLEQLIEQYITVVECQVIFSTSSASVNLLAVDTKQNKNGPNHKNKHKNNHKDVPNTYVDFCAKYRASFRMVVLDESCQMCEPEAFIPLTKGARWVLLVGDDQQLRPCVKTVSAQRSWGYGKYGASLMGRLGMGLVRLDCQRLTTTYRMHPAIADFSSKFFYEGQVKSARGPEIACLGEFWASLGVRNRPLALVDVDSPEERASDFLNRHSHHCEGLVCSPFCLSQVDGRLNVPRSQSFFNCSQAYACLKVLWTFLKDPALKSVCIISTYRAQQQIIAGLLDRLSPEIQTRRPGAVVESSTVDSFQGQEADVIILCTVRNNPQNNAGHIRDPRRLNVAVTRARHGLVVVGCSSFLHATMRAKTPGRAGRQDCSWGALCEYIGEAATVNFSHKRIARVLEPIPGSSNFAGLGLSDDHHQACRHHQPTRKQKGRGGR